MAIIRQLGSRLAAVVQDVETRWWSTFDMVDRLLYLENPIKLYDREDRNGGLLSETELGILRLIKHVLEPFMTAQRLLEGEKYVTVSLLVPYISDLEDGLNHASDYLKLLAPANDPVEIATKRAMIPCVNALIETVGEKA